MESFEAIVRDQASLVFRTLTRLCGRQASVEDLAQEVFLRLFRALPHFRGEAKLETYLHRIILNVAKDEWARRKKAQQVVSLDDDGPAWAERLALPGPGPADEAEQNQFLAALDGAMDRLELDDRAILALCYQEERSYREIAAILNLPIGTVKTNLFRAKQKLRSILKEQIASCPTPRRTAAT